MKLDSAYMYELENKILKLSSYYSNFLNFTKYNLTNPKAF